MRPSFQRKFQNTADFVEYKANYHTSSKGALLTRGAMTNKREFESGDAHVISTARHRSDTNGVAKDLASPRTTRNKRILGNLGAWRYGKYLQRVNQKNHAYI